MESCIKVLSIFGTRPEAIKMAPVIKELSKRNQEFKSIVTVTAQHREMLDQVLKAFNIEPDYDLDLMEKDQTLTDITKRTLEGLDQILRKVKPDIVLVHGDTTTTFAASLASFYNQIPIGHVEAGLRTWNKYSPFPEEINRQLTGVIADIHFSPTEKSKKNLINENKQINQIHVTGNTAIDALQTTVSRTYSHPILESIKDKRLILMTAHRRENLGHNMEQIFRAVKRLVKVHKDIHVIYPVHLNPAVRKSAEKILGNNEQIQLIEPLNVVDFHNLMAKAYLILTDSGGLQEEAPSLGIPVLVLRDTTERPEGIEAGTLKLAGINEDDIFELSNKLLSDKIVYNKMAQASNPYGDGKASKRIADIIIDYFNKN